MRGVLRGADDDLLDLVELMHPEPATGGAASGTGLGAEARGERGDQDRQVLGVKDGVAVVADKGLFRGADQREILAFDLVNLVREERQITRAEQHLLPRHQGRHHRRESALDEKVLGVGEQRPGQASTGSPPVVEAGTGDLSTAGKVEDPEAGADDIVGASLVSRHGITDAPQLDVALVVFSGWRVLGKQVRHARPHGVPRLLQDADLIGDPLQLVLQGTGSLDVDVAATLGLAFLLGTGLL